MKKQLLSITLLAMIFTTNSFAMMGEREGLVEGRPDLIEQQQRERVEQQQREIAMARREAMRRRIAQERREEAQAAQQLQRPRVRRRLEFNPNPAERTHPY